TRLAPSCAVAWGCCLVMNLATPPGGDGSPDASEMQTRRPYATIAAGGPGGSLVSAAHRPESWPCWPQPPGAGVDPRRPSPTGATATPTPILPCPFGGTPEVHPGVTNNNAASPAASAAAFRVFLVFPLIGRAVLLRVRSRGLQLSQPPNAIAITRDTEPVW